MGKIGANGYDWEPIGGVQGGTGGGGNIPIGTECAVEGGSDQDSMGG